MLVIIRLAQLKIKKYSKTAVQSDRMLEEVYLRHRAAVRPAPFRPILHATEDGGRKEGRESARLRGRIEERSYPIPSRLIDKPPRTRPDSDGKEVTFILTWFKSSPFRLQDHASFNICTRGRYFEQFSFHQELPRKEQLNPQIRCGTPIQFPQR